MVKPSDVPGDPKLMCILPPTLSQLRWHCPERALPPVLFLVHYLQPQPCKAADQNSIVTEDRRPSLTLFSLKVSNDLDMDSPPAAFPLLWVVMMDIPNPSLFVWSVMLCPTVFGTGQSALYSPCETISFILSDPTMSFQRGTTPIASMDVVEGK